MRKRRSVMGKGSLMQLRIKLLTVKGTGRRKNTACRWTESDQSGRRQISDGEGAYNTELDNGRKLEMVQMQNRIRNIKIRD